jgi:hypothetical protein
MGIYIGSMTNVPSSVQPLAAGYFSVSVPELEWAASACVEAATCTLLKPETNLTSNI